jgi:hypothetical protein
MEYEAGTLTIFSLLSYFEKNSVGLRDHVAVCVCVCVWALYPPYRY